MVLPTRWVDGLSALANLRALFVVAREVQGRSESSDKVLSFRARRGRKFRERKLFQVNLVHSLLGDLFLLKRQQLLPWLRVLTNWVTSQNRLCHSIWRLVLQGTAELGTGRSSTIPDGRDAGGLKHLGRPVYALFVNVKLLSDICEFFASLEIPVEISIVAQQHFELLVLLGVKARRFRTA